MVAVQHSVYKGQIQSQSTIIQTIPQNLWFAGQLLSLSKIKSAKYMLRLGSNKTRVYQS